MEQTERNKHSSAALSRTLIFLMLNYVVQRISIHGFAVLLSLVADIDEEMTQIKYLYFIHKVELLSSTSLALQY